MTAEARPLPYYFLEVSTGSGEALAPRDYFGEAYSSGGAADITEFTFVGVGDKFLEKPGQYIAQLNPNGPPGSQFSPTAWGLMPSDKAVVFLAEPRHPALRRNHKLPRRQRVSRRQRMDAGAALRVPLNPLEPTPLPARRELRGPPVRWKRTHQRRDLCGELRNRGDRRVGLRASRSLHPEHGALPEGGRRHRRQSLVGRRRECHRLLARQQGLRGHQPRGHDGDRHRPHRHAGRVLLRPPDRGPERRSLRRRHGGRGFHRRGRHPPAHQFRDRDRHRRGSPKDTPEGLHETTSGLLRRVRRGSLRLCYSIPFPNLLGGPGVDPRRGLLRGLRPLVLRQRTATASAT